MPEILSGTAYELTALAAWFRAANRPDDTPCPFADADDEWDAKQSAQEHRDDYRLEME